MNRRAPSASNELEIMISGLLKSGFSRSEIARRVGLTKATISRYESGEIRRPSVDNFRSIERVFKTLHVRK